MLYRGVAIILCFFISSVSAVLAQTPETTQLGNRIVTLHVLVVGHDGIPLTDLNQSELEIYQGKEKLPIESITRAPDAPAEIGFLIDNSNSEGGALRTLKWQRDADPAAGLLRTGDRAFVATFARDRSLTCPLTTDLLQAKTALHNALTPSSVGGVTSFYDAIFWASSEEFPTHSGHNVLILISDMEDNTSEHTRDEAVAQAQKYGVSIFPISLQAVTPRAIAGAKTIASKTGGLPSTDYGLDDLRKTFRMIRSVIDNAYIVAYSSKSTGPSRFKIRCTRNGARILIPDQGL